MLKVESISKSYRNLEAVRSLSFEVRPGEVLGLLGPNGAGKTTSLRTLAGALKPDQGSIHINGLDLSKAPVEAKMQIAFLPDSPTFFGNLTCWDHVRFIAKVYQVEDFEKKATALFDRLDLTSKKNEFPNALSKGMCQRLGLICAFLHNPRPRVPAPACDTHRRTRPRKIDQLGV